MQGHKTLQLVSWYFSVQKYYYLLSASPFPSVYLSRKLWAKAKFWKVTRSSNLSCLLRFCFSIFYSPLSSFCSCVLFISTARIQLHGSRIHPHLLQPCNLDRTQHMVGDTMWHLFISCLFCPIPVLASFRLPIFFAFLKRFFKSLLILWEHCTYTTSVNKKVETFSLWAQRWILDPSGSSNTHRSRSWWAVVLAYLVISSATVSCPFASSKALALGWRLSRVCFEHWPKHKSSSYLLLAPSWFLSTPCLFV